MASLVLGVAGAAIGSFFGPLGTSIGWAIGSAVGGMLFSDQPDQQGPRLTDLKIQNSSYGVGIPIGYGTDRISGNVIWTTDLVETEHKSGGKGGAPEVTTYSYSVSFAVELCQTSFIDGNGTLVNNPIKGISRIWADGRLIYGPGSPGNAYPFTIYYGTEDQEPDPTIEAEEGAGNVPAFRGYAYVVFDALQLQEFGNRVPNFTWEVIFDGDVTLEIYSAWPVDFEYPINNSAYSFAMSLNGVDSISSPGNLVLHRYRSGQDYGGVGFPGDFELSYERREYNLHGELISDTGEVNQAVLYNVNGWRVFGSMNSGIAYTRGQITLSCSGCDDGFPTSRTANTFAWYKDGVMTYTPYEGATCPLCAVALASGVAVAELGLSITSSPILWGEYVYACGGNNIDTLWVRRWPTEDGGVYTADHDCSFNLRDYTHDGADGEGFDLVVGDDGFLYCSTSYSGGAFPDPEVIGGWGTKLLRFDRELNLVRVWLDQLGTSDVDPGKLPVPSLSSFTIYRGYFIGYYSAGYYAIGVANFIMWRMDPGSSALIFQDEIRAPAMFDGNSPATGSPVTPIVYIQNGYAAYRGGILKLDAGGITLGEIVANVSRRMGYDSTEYDVSELTDIVKGYTLAERMSGRAAIDTLRPAYQFGAVESNQTVKFRKWTGEVDATIPDDDLGARPADEDPVEIFEVTRALESELPQQVDVVFKNIDLDYQEGNQLRQREVTSSELHTTVSVPVVLTDAEALEIADVLLHNAWVERDRFKTQLPRKWSHLEPTDVLAIKGRSMRITTKEEVGYTHIPLEGLATSTGVFITAPVATGGIGFVPQPVPVPNATDLLLLDLPLITDVDFDNGFYAAVTGHRSGAWPGASILKSIDGGVNYSAIAGVSTPVSQGRATTTLGDFTDGNVFDEINSVTVRLSPGSPELSSSNELGLLNGANMAALYTDDGYEIFQYRDAALVGTRTYTLTGLLRGRRGTEWAIAGHAFDDIFVALPAFNLEGLGSEIGQEREYKAITTGQPATTGIVKEFTNTAIALRPYAPVLLGGGRNAANDVILTWVRRTRIGGAWVDYADSPLSEDSESYALNFYDDSSYTNLVYSAGAVTQTYTLTAAEQTANMGGLQNPLYWGVQQLGSSRDGYEARGVT